MYNNWLRVTVLAFVSWATISLTSTGETADRSIAATTVTVTTWSVTGEQTFVSSFPKIGNNGPRVVSRLQYPLNLPLHEFSMEVPVGKQRSIRMGYANNTIQAGQGNDTDWDYAQSQDVWYYGTFQTSGSSQYYNIELVNKQAGFAAIVGYRTQTNFFRMQDGHYETDDYLAVDYSLPSLDSTYEITYEGIWLGLQGEKPVNPKLTVEGSIFYSPYLQAKAVGDWNLRPMTFDEKGIGQGFEGNLALTYTPHHQFDISVGYRYRWLKQEGGTDTTYFSGNTYAADWDEAVSIQQGIMAKMNYRF